jgi:Tol biopolymer transport system component
MTYSAGEIEIISLADGKISALPGASGNGFVNDMPSWSPDGKKLLFCRYIPNPGTNAINPVKIYRIPFNGGKGGTATLLFKNPPSNYCYFPKYSPDGKFVSFVSGDASKGYFARKSSTIWILSLENNSMKKLSFNIPGEMNSWHSWSTDGNWLVFSATRPGRLLTSLYLARIGRDGEGYPSVLIAFDDSYKVNLPFLVPGSSRLDFGKNLGRFIESMLRQDKE